LIEIKHDGIRIIARKSGGRVRLYSCPDNDFTRRFPLIADAPPKWLSKKCRPLSKKCKLNRPSAKWVPGGGRAAHPSAKKTIMKTRAYHGKLGLGTRFRNYGWALVGSCSLVRFVAESIYEVKRNDTKQRRHAFLARGNSRS
jgi:hypothetical protein